jgi:hypothetical protein
MDKLVSDRAEAEISSKVQDILRHLCIDDWQSEPHYQKQNPAECRFQTVKTNTNRVLNMSGAPAFCWLLCLQYVIFIMNRTALESLDWRTPHEMLTGSTPDISMITRFKFWDDVYVKRDESQGKCFPSESNEIKAKFVGFSESVGHSMTYKVLTVDTNKILYRSRIKLASLEPNRRIDTVPDPSDVVFSKNSNSTRKLATLDPDELIGRSYLSPPLEDGEIARIKILEALHDLDDTLVTHPDMVKFRCASDDGKIDEILSYNDILEKLEDQDGEAGEWHFKSIDAHQGPLTPSDSGYKGSRWNVRVNWENGETTYEPLGIIGKSDPASCAMYADRNGLLHLEGWKQFARLARRRKKLLRMANQAKLQSFRTRPKFKFGVQVPRNHAEAMEFDAANGNTKWRDAELVELAQIDEYDTFEDVGKFGKVPVGFKKIRVHMVNDMKHDGRYKARLVAGGHLTETPIDSVYSSVVSLRGL